MRNYTFDLIRKRHSVTNKVEGLVPAPFPGQYPTRIGFQIQVVGRPGLVEYNGKPNRDYVSQFLRLLNTAKWSSFHYYEYDRKYILAGHSHNGKPRQGALLFRYYHPFCSQGDIHGDFKVPFTIKRIAEQVLYAPVLDGKKLKAEQVEAHRAWLYKNQLATVEQLGKEWVEAHKATVQLVARVFKGTCPFCGYPNSQTVFPIGNMYTPFTKRCRNASCREIINSEHFKDLGL